MKIQVLVATMHQMDHSLLKKMNIQTDVIVGNQCERNSIEKFDYNKNCAIYLNFAERGVGLNRNNALMRATGDICMFADDDMVYVDGYPLIVEKAFLAHPDADVILFNLFEKIPKRYVIRKEQRVYFYNFLRYGTARIAIKLSSIKNKGIYFNQCFGGGTEHSHGEDNLFLSDCLKEGLVIYALPIGIATLTEERSSTWNNGNYQKYLRDQGCLYQTISQKWWKILCFQDAIRRSKKSYKMSWIKAYSIMVGKETNGEKKYGKF